MQTVAIFRPEGRLGESKEVLEKFGFEMVAKPVLKPSPTGKHPFTSAEFVIFTSTNGVKFALSSLEASDFDSSTVCAIGPKTAEALKDRGVSVDIVPEEYSSRGLVTSLSSEVRENKVEVARSSEGSKVLLDGLNQAGAFVHETELYTLERVPASEGEIEKIIESAGIFLFTSSLTVNHFLGHSNDRQKVIRKLNRRFVGALGQPTKRTLIENDVSVDLVASKATFTTLVEETRSHLNHQHSSQLKER